MLVALLLLLVQHQLTSCDNHHDHSGQHGIHQQPWSHGQQYENDDNETLVLHDNRSWSHTDTPQYM